jgi:hypothetical protein
MHNIQLETLMALRQFVTLHELPKTDFSLYGVRCPYCGKIDRIGRLESPEELRHSMETEAMANYETLWKIVIRTDRSLGVCRFCQNLLGLKDDMTAEPLVE